MLLEGDRYPWFPVTPVVNSPSETVPVLIPR